MMKLNKVFLFFVFLSLSTDIYGQSESKKFRAGIFVGYPLGFFDLPRSGFHLSFNPTRHFNQHLALEGQVSISKMKFGRNDNFFGHDGGSATNFNLLAGLRLYILKEKHKVRPYARLLLGFGAGHDTKYNADNFLYKEQLAGVSVAADLCVEVGKNWNFCLGLEGPSVTFGLKAGYTF
jgi:hypothetical protein